MRKTFLSILLAFCVVISSLPSAALAAGAGNTGKTKLMSDTEIIEVADSSQLKTAFDGIHIGVTIRLTKSINTNYQFEVLDGCEIILDLGGFTLTNTNENSDNPFITNNGTLTVTGGSVGSTKTSITAIQNSGTLTVTNGILSGGYCVNSTGGTVTINGGTFSSGVSSIKTSAGTELTINGGSYTSNSIVFDISGACEINDGLFLSTGYCILNVNKSGSCSINGGEFDGGDNFYSIVNAGAVILNGGRFKGYYGEAGTYPHDAGFEGIAPVLGEGKELSAEPGSGFYAVTPVGGVVDPNVLTLTPVVTEGVAQATVPSDFDPAANAAAVISAKTEGNMSETQITIPAAVLGNVLDAASLTLKTDAADITFDQAALTSIDSGAGSDAVMLSVASKEKTELLPAQQASVSDGAAILDLSLTAGGNPISFTGGASVKVPFTKPDAAKNYNAFYISETGARTALPSTPGGGFMSFTAGHFSVYAIDEAAGFTLEIVESVEGAHYHAGDTITADIYAAAASETIVGSFGFTLAYDTDKLTLTGITTTLDGNLQVNGARAGFTISGETGITVGATPVQLATATFAVKEGATTGTTSVSLTGTEVSRVGDDLGAGHVVMGEDFALYRVFSVSFATPLNGTLSSMTTLSIEDGLLLGSLTLPTPTADTHYGFSGWYIDEVPVDIETYQVTSDITLSARFLPASYGVTFNPVTGASYGSINGVADGKAVFGTDVTFTVTPDASYAILGVSYTVAGGTGEPLDLADGKYTIPGGSITGAVTVSVGVVHYRSLTFAAGGGVNMTGITLYAKDGEAGLYSDMTCQTSASLPTPTATEGYRLAKDTSDEPLWSDGADGWQSDSITSGIFNTDKTFTAQAIKTWQVSFAAGANGSLSGTLTKTVDDNYYLTPNDIPTPVPAVGYMFDDWNLSPYQTIEKDMTFTAIFTPGVYDLTLSGGEAATFTRTGDYTEGRATYGTDVTFTMAVNANYAVTEVKYSVAGGVQNQTLTPSEGVYTIPGGNIIGAVSVSVVSNQTYTLTFEAGSNGTVSGGPFVINMDDKLTAAQLAEVSITPNAGYEFVKWQKAGEDVTAETILATAYNANLTFTAVFGHDSFNVTVPDNVTGIAETATHGMDLTFIPEKTGAIVTGVSYQVGDGDATPITANADGSYTIAGTAITGDITISVNTIEGASFSFISHGEYMGLANGTKIAVLSTARLGSGRYQLSGGKELYWSGKYNAYVVIVSNDETAATLSAGLNVNASQSTTDINYDGDINGVGGVTPVDAMIINDILHDNRTETSDMYRFRADVNGDKTVSTADVTWTLQTAVGLSPTEG